MKRGKKPTRAQKVFISGYRLRPENWLVVSDMPEAMTIIHKHTDTVRELKKV